MKTLFINACVRENSRTLVIAREVMKNIENEVTEIRLNEEGIKPLDSELLQKREELIKSGRTDDAMLRYAREFAEADEIVIAAPFWDLSFPALLKIYLEHICVAGITFEYKMGAPVGLCRAKRLIYVTTSGGEIYTDFGYSYVKELARTFFGIKDTVCYRAVNMDFKQIAHDRVLSDAPIITVE